MKRQQNFEKNFRTLNNWEIFFQILRRKNERRKKNNAHIFFSIWNYRKKTLESNYHYYAYTHSNWACKSRSRKEIFARWSRTLYLAWYTRVPCILWFLKNFTLSSELGNDIFTKGQLISKFLVPSISSKKWTEISQSEVS